MAILLNLVKKQCTVLKGTMSTSHEYIKLIKYSPRRRGIFRRIKDNIYQAIDSGRTGVRSMCHTRSWNIKVDAPRSLISNGMVLQSGNEHIPLYLYGIMLDEILLKYDDNLNRAQHKSLSAAEGQQVASMIVATLNAMSNYTYSGQR